MATIKTYTDLGQSKELSKILRFESADMCYKCIEDDPYDIICKPYSEWKEEYKGLLVGKEVDVIPCWSLAALMNVLPKLHKLQHTENGYYCSLANYKCVTEAYNNPVDACVTMIEKLHKLKML